MRVGDGSVPEAAFGLIFFWLAYERLDHSWDMQWPWFSLGNVFATKPAWIQWYEYSGMLGGSLWIMLVNLFTDRAILAWRKQRPPIVPALRALTALLLLIVPLIFSINRYNNYEEKGRLFLGVRGQLTRVVGDRPVRGKGPGGTAVGPASRPAGLAAALRPGAAAKRAGSSPDSRPRCPPRWRPLRCERL